MDETFLVNLSNLAAGGRNVTLADSQGQGKITNDDSASLSVNDVMLAEGNAGTTSYTFTVTLGAAVDAPFTRRFCHSRRHRHDRRQRLHGGFGHAELQWYRRRNEDFDRRA